MLKLLIIFLLQVTGLIIQHITGQITLVKLVEETMMEHQQLTLSIILIMIQPTGSIAQDVRIPAVQLDIIIVQHLQNIMIHNTGQIIHVQLVEEIMMEQSQTTHCLG